METLKNYKFLHVYRGDRGLKATSIVDVTFQNYLKDPARYRYAESGGNYNNTSEMDLITFEKMFVSNGECLLKPEYVARNFLLNEVKYSKWSNEIPLSKRSKVKIKDLVEGNIYSNISGVRGIFFEIEGRKFFYNSWELRYGYSEKALKDVIKDINSSLKYGVYEFKTIPTLYSDLTKESNEHTLEIVRLLKEHILSNSNDYVNKL